MTGDSGGDSAPPRILPLTVTPGRRTPTFTSETVPPALLKAHLTNAWAELVVTAGFVRFFDEDPPWSTTAVPGSPVVIFPGRRHHIEPVDGAEFFVQFHDDPAGGESSAEGPAASTTSDEADK